MSNAPKYSCWLKRNTNPLKCDDAHNDFLSSIPSLENKELEFLKSLTYNYCIAISTRLEEPKSCSLCYMLEVISEKSEILDVICDVLTISEKDSKRISMEYIGIFNEIFGKHESDIIHATGDSLQEVKDKIECSKQKTTTSI